MKLRSLLLLSLIPVMNLAACNSTNQEYIPYIESFDGIYAQQMSIRRTASGTDSNGHDYQVISYTLVPSNSVRNAISVTLSFADNRVDGNDYLTISHDSSEQEIRVTCMQAFDSVATIHLESNYDSNVYANVEVRYNARHSLNVPSTITSNIAYSQWDTLETGTSNRTSNFLYILNNSGWSITMSPNTEEPVNLYGYNFGAGYTINGTITHLEVVTNYQAISDDSEFVLKCNIEKAVATNFQLGMDDDEVPNLRVMSPLSYYQQFDNSWTPTLTVNQIKDELENLATVNSGYIDYRVNIEASLSVYDSNEATVSIPLFDGEVGFGIQCHHQMMSLPSQINAGPSIYF